MQDLSKDDFLALKDKVKVHKIENDDIGGAIYVKEMTGDEKDQFDQWLANGNDKTRLLHLRGRIAVLTMVNPDGTRMFTDDEVYKLGLLPAKVLDAVYNTVFHVNDIDDNKLEDLTKNSDPAPCDSSAIVLDGN